MNGPVQCRIVSKLDHRVATFVPDDGTNPALMALGKRGQLKAIPPIFENAALENQRFELRPALAHGQGVFSIHLVKDPTIVLRFTPMAPIHKVNMWMDDPNAPNQFWKIQAGGKIHLNMNPLVNLHTQGDAYNVGAAEEGFYLDLVTHELGIFGNAFGIGI